MAPLYLAPHFGSGCGGCWQAQVTRGAGLDAHGRMTNGAYVWLRDSYLWTRDSRDMESTAYRLFVPDEVA